MNTCGFCASEIDNNFCSFCEMELQDKHIMIDGHRFNQAERFEGYPAAHEIHKSTSELMKEDTIRLLCLLREARSARAEVYQLRILRHQAEKESGMTDDVKDIEEQTFNEYEKSTRKVWVIENIIKERLGYFPQRVTNNFLNMYLDRMKASEEKKMILRQSIKKDK